ncbi:MFS transporter [Candidatus Dojkabacteria bacterium]|nr:MFS transporter [Candidatus Dojkabacteria bacterium]
MISLKRFSSQFNAIIKILIVSDFIVWSADNMLSIIFPLFVIQTIENGSLEVAGLASMIYLVVSAVFSLLMGIIMDRIRGNVDEFYFLTVGTFVRGLTLFCFVFVSNVWQLYLLQFFLGITRASMYPSWMILFTKYNDNSKAGLGWGAYDTITTVGMGLSAYLGSLIPEDKNFNYVFNVASGLTILGAFSLIFIRSNIGKLATKK